MKKIMFNSKYGLDKAVIEGWKTMTRRVISCPNTFKGQLVSGFYICRNRQSREITEVCMHDADEGFIDNGQLLPNYKVGEVVAIAQSYKDCGYDPNFMLDGKPINKYPGWNNKMFVKAELMKHFIKITGVKVERLQDISYTDIAAEGIKYNIDVMTNLRIFMFPNGEREFLDDRTAFRTLIDKISGKGTWKSNPWVWAYEFELTNNRNK